MQERERDTIKKKCENAKKGGKILILEALNLNIFIYLINEI